MSLLHIPIQSKVVTDSPVKVLNKMINVARVNGEKDVATFNTHVPAFTVVLKSFSTWSFVFTWNGTHFRVPGGVCFFFFSRGNWCQIVPPFSNHWSGILGWRFRIVDSSTLSKSECCDSGKLHEPEPS